LNIRYYTTFLNTPASLLHRMILALRKILGHRPS